MQVMIRQSDLDFDLDLHILLKPVCLNNWVNIVFWAYNISKHSFKKHMNKP